MNANSSTATTRDNKTGRFMYGNPGGPGGSRVSGRTRALQLLDQMLEDEENLDLLHKALEENFRKNPVRFFRQIIMPLLPREAKLDVDTGPVHVVWHSLAETFPPEEAGSSTPST